MKVRTVVLLVLGWKLALSAMVWLGTKLLPYRPTFAGSEKLIFIGPRWLTTWIHFDGVHYLTIAEKGYVGTALIQAFFPGYPLLLRWFSMGIFDRIVIGQVISVVCLIFGLYVLYRLVRLDEPKITAQKTMWLYLLFPTAFFFGAVYGESLFLLLVVVCMYFARKKRWFWAGVVGVLAALTRLPGVFLVPFLCFEYMMVPKKSLIGWLSCLMPLMGLGLYMVYLNSVFGDPLLFYHVQSAFGASRETGTLVLLPQVFYRYGKMLFTVPVSNPLFYPILQELLTAIAGLILLSIGWFRVRRSYILFAALALIAPTLTGNFSSLPRYVLPLFPLYMVMAKMLRGKWFYLAGFLFAILQIVNLLLFTQGIWVA